MKVLDALGDVMHPTPEKIAFMVARTLLSILLTGEPYRKPEPEVLHWRYDAGSGDGSGG